MERSPNSLPQTAVISLILAIQLSIRCTQSTRLTLQTHDNVPPSHLLTQAIVNL